MNLAGEMHRMEREVIKHNKQYHNGDQRYHNDWRSRFLGMSFELEPHVVHAHSDGRHHTHKIDAVKGLDKEMHGKCRYFRMCPTRKSTMLIMC